MKIEICGIVKKFGKRSILNSVNIEAHEGTCIGVLGVNGSGKSTLFNILAGISYCDAGSFLFNGVDLLRHKEKMKNIVGYVPQNVPLLEELTCIDNLKLWYSNKQISQELENGVLKMLGIGEFLKTPVRKMSGGMKKRLAIACAVANNPDILIMDEPSAALDIICKKTVAEYIEYFKSRGGIVILSTHEIAELEVCDVTYILKNGVAQKYEFDGNTEKLIGCL